MHVRVQLANVNYRSRSKEKSVCVSVVIHSYHYIFTCANITMHTEMHKYTHAHIRMPRTSTCAVRHILCNPRSPGTHIVGPWVIDSINVYRDVRTGTQYIGIWASR